MSRSRSSGNTRLLRKHRFLATTVFIFLFIFFFESFWHNAVLGDLYADTPDIWLSGEEVKNYYFYTIALQIFMSVTITYALALVRRECKKVNFVAIGLCFGCLMGIMQLNLYAILPLSLSLTFLWSLGSVLTGVGAGAIFKIINRK